MVPISHSKRVTFLFPISNSEERTHVCLLDLVDFLLLAYSTRLQHLKKKDGFRFVNYALLSFIS